jgi:hypothetical protein
VLPFALVTALAAAGALPFPIWGKYAAIGLGVLAIASGLAGFRRGKTGPARLWAAAAAALGAVALVLGGVKVALTLLALGHLREVLR